MMLRKSEKVITLAAPEFICCPHPKLHAWQRLFAKTNRKRGNPSELVEIT